MIVSMTAFGRKESDGPWGHAACEIKTVNHRYLEIAIRLPEDLRQLENGIRKLISTRLNRGKVDCTLRYEPDESIDNEIPLNLELATRLMNIVEKLPVRGMQPMNPFDILRWPGVIQKDPPDADTLSEPILKLVDETLDIIIAGRQWEGKQLGGMILDRCEITLTHVKQLKEQLPALIESQRSRIINRANELSISLDHDRLEQEMLLLINKMDVAEELDRLESHIAEVKRLLNQDSPAGRRLDFLMQEMNREANTLGSKACNIAVTNNSVDLKVLIEQMREQIQNIE